MADIQTGPNGSAGKVFAVSGGRVYFTADNGTETSIWVTDGTVIGTYALNTIAVPERFHRYVETTTFRGDLYFTIKYDGTAHKLWKTNGTVLGTKLIVSFNSTNFGTDTVFDSNGHHFIEFKNNAPVDLYGSSVLNKVIIKTTSPILDNQVFLRTTDGTPGNLEPIESSGSMLKEIAFYSFHELDNTLYFQGRDTTSDFTSYDHMDDVPFGKGKQGLYKISGEDMPHCCIGELPDIRIYGRIPLCEESIQRVRVGLGYFNPGTGPIHIPVGENNLMEGMDEEQLKGIDIPTEFLPGFHYIEFDVENLEPGNRLSWSLNGEEGISNKAELVIPDEGTFSRNVLYDGSNGKILPPSEVTPFSARIPYGVEPWCGEFFFRFRIRTIFDVDGNDIAIEGPNHYFKEMDIPKSEIALGETLDIEGLSPGVTYEYHLTTLVDGQVGDLGIGHRFTTPFVKANQRQRFEKEKSEDQVVENRDIVLYPNPAQNRLKIHVPKRKDIKNISIFSVTGKKEMEVELRSNDISVDVERLPNGIYFLRAKSKGGIISKKFLKH